MLLDNVHWKFKQREKKHLRMLDAQEISKPQRKSRKLPREMSKDSILMSHGRVG